MHYFVKITASVDKEWYKLFVYAHPVAWDSDGCRVVVLRRH
jgi:hypothetical protein